MKKLMVLVSALLITSSVFASNESTCVDKYQLSSDRIARNLNRVGRIDQGTGIVYVVSVLALTSVGVPALPALVAVPLAVGAAQSHRRKLNEVIRLVNESGAMINNSSTDISTLVEFQEELASKSKVNLELDVIANELIRLNDSGELCDGTAGKVRTVNVGRPQNNQTRKVKNQNALKSDLLDYFKKI